MTGSRTISLACLAAVAFFAWTAMRGDGGRSVASSEAAAVRGAEGASVGSVRGPLAPSGPRPVTDAPPGEAAESEQERNEAAIEDFDDLTDRWMEPAEGGVSPKDVENFVAAFRRVPAGRRDECIHRALNLIPDGNVLLLAGVLLDETMDKDVVETVFNDVLNRDETVKAPILQMIYKRKNHPCWADAAWILDVTGETRK